MLTNSVDQTLRRRADRVVPGSMWGHLHASKLPPGFPQFYARAEGARIWDVDGRCYLDFMCAWGPNLLGYGNAEVDEAAMRQQSLGDTMNGPSEVMVDLAELLVETVGHADWAMFQKNGTDATTTCVTIARAHTGRRKVLIGRGAYHGAAPWCSPSVVGVTAEDRTHLCYFDYNDLGSLEAAAREAGADLAAIIVSPVRQERDLDQEFPTAQFANAVRAICDRTDAVLILDEVRTGLRLHLEGSWQPLGIEPDLAAWSKALANGYPLAAVTGKDHLRAAAAGIFVTGSFWCSAVPMAAGIATINIVKRERVIERLLDMGGRLRAGIAALAERHGVALRQTGPVQMPSIRFDNDPGLRKGDLFCQAALDKGVYFHPWHNMFLSASHGLAEIEEAIAAADVALAAVAERFGG